jgi:hypothetical protein
MIWWMVISFLLGVALGISIGSNPFSASTQTRVPGCPYTSRH